MAETLYHSVEIEDVGGNCFYGDITSPDGLNPSMGDMVLGATKHQVAFFPDGGTTGTCTIVYVPAGRVESGGTVEVKNSAGTTITVDLANGNQVVQFEAVTRAIVILGSGISGTYSATFAGW